ncbi:MAG: DUF3299 domain-containing protein [Lentilitoribacter sp.]
MTRRNMISAVAAGTVLPNVAQANTPIELAWEDLIPPGLPYSEIIGEGEMDERNDVWLPLFDENATKLNPILDGAYIKMPGFILPIDVSTAGVTTFVLVPYVGACLHTPPPPANQLVYVTTEKPWQSDDLWEAIWVTGQIQHELQTTEVAETGYLLAAEEIEVYVW